MTALTLIVGQCLAYLTRTEWMFKRLQSFLKQNISPLFLYNSWVQE